MIAPDHDRQRLLDSLHRNQGLPPRWEPTPAEIAAACEAIRATWSEKEHVRRASTLTDEDRRRVHYEVPTIATSDLGH